MEVFIKKIDRPEHILCSAIWYDDGVKRDHLPANVESGIVACGLRHSNCFTVLITMFPDRRYLKTSKQGFLTSKGRFVNRREAWKIALSAGQVEPEPWEGSQLFSENLW